MRFVNIKLHFIIALKNSTAESQMRLSTCAARTGAQGRGEEPGADGKERIQALPSPDLY